MQLTPERIEAYNKNRREHKAISKSLEGLREELPAEMNISECWNKLRAVTNLAETPEVKKYLAGVIINLKDVLSTELTRLDLEAQSI